jgi:hypothetical protein
MSGTLITYRGAVKVPKEALLQIEAPQPTTTWRPIPHSTLVNTLGEILSNRGLAVKREEYAIQRNGNILFGVMDLVWGGTVEYYAALGLRTSNNKSFAIQIAIGARVVICDNLLMSGELIALKRKHTAKLDLIEELNQAIRRYELGYQQLEKGIQRLKQCEISLTETREMLFNVFAARIVPVKLFHHVATPYIRTPDCVTLIPVWEVHNAFTNVLKKLPPGVAFDANVKLGKFFGLN